MIGRRSGENLGLPRLDAVGPGSRAVVVFSGETDLPYLRLLRPGFRHCCLVVEAGRYWLFFNPTSADTGVMVYDGLGLDDIVGWFLANRDTVVCCRVRAEPAAPALFRPYSCVEAVKRILGLHAVGVYTPWQLFQWLTRIGNMKKIIN